MSASYFCCRIYVNLGGFIYLFRIENVTALYRIFGIINLGIFPLVSANSLSQEKRVPCLLQFHFILCL